jgi:hypothetical protein
MTTTTATPDYLIRAYAYEYAQEIAEDLKLVSGSWFYIPFTLEERNPQVFKKSEPTSPVDEQEVTPELALEGQTSVRLLLAANFWLASEYALARGWNFEAWSWVSLPVIDDIVEYHVVEA